MPAVSSTRAVVSVRRPPLVPRSDTPNAAAWITVRAIENLTTRYVIDRPAIERDVFIAEVERLARQCLAGFGVDVRHFDILFFKPFS